MQPVETVKLNLPVDIITSMNEAVASGRYHTQDEVALVALEQWRLRQQILREELGKLWDEGIASGRSPYSSAAEIIAEARRRKGLPSSDI